MMETYDHLEIKRSDDLIFGHSPRPLTLANGLVIGGGTVYPELNFTLPAMSIAADTMPEIREQCSQIIENACARAVDLHLEGLVIEFELFPEMTRTPEWGAEITAVLRRTLDRFAQSDGLKSALRVTPNDIREFERPPICAVARSGTIWCAVSSCARRPGLICSRLSQLVAKKFTMTRFCMLTCQRWRLRWGYWARATWLFYGI